VSDNVDHPPHYQSGGLEAIDVIEAFKLDFCTGNAVKYLLRAGKKDPAKFIEDLAKAKWYIERAIEKAPSAALPDEKAPSAALPDEKAPGVCPETLPDGFKCSFPVGHAGPHVDAREMKLR
jgi:hypothetical protein